MSDKKILSLDNLKKIISNKKLKGKKIVLCHGVFDLLHIGHIKHFNEAKKLGHYLVVTTTPDSYVNKGPGRPVFSSNLRLQALAALESIDYVSENKWPSAVETIKYLQPNIYCKGPDYQRYNEDITGKIEEEEKAIRSIGGKIKFTNDITFSSSNILNKFGSIYNESQASLLKKIKANYNYNKIKLLIDSLKKLKVLIVGETIIDEYIFCEALGKSGKEPVLAIRDLKSQQYAGGASVIARHLSDFCGSITFLSMLGETREHERFVKENFSKNVKTTFIYKKGSPTIVKKRYVDDINNNKVLGVYSINDDELNKTNEEQFQKNLLKLIPRHDLVIVADFGHGFISRSSAKIISKKSNSIALNAQVNAANIGYHSMDKYEKIQCIVINEAELRHQFREKKGSLIPLMKKLSTKHKALNLVVTQGKDGAMLYHRKSDKIEVCPAFASSIIDKVGAGDAMLALLSISLHKSYDKSISLFIGSLAAAQSVESIGNSKAVNKNQMLKTIQHLLK